MRLHFGVFTMIVSAACVGVGLAIEPGATTSAPATSTSGVSTSASTTPAPAGMQFDPARHMRVADVRKGMKGYFKTVIQGSKIEQFDVEVIDILHNAFGPSQDVILIRAKGELMDHVGPVQGMSGSPVYLFDGKGTPLLIGAYAFGWGLSKDPLVGVQPIERMLTLNARAQVVPADPAVGNSRLTNRADHQAGGKFDLIEQKLIPQLYKGQLAEIPALKSQAVFATQATNQLTPLAIPLNISGIDPRQVEQMSSMFGPFGLRPVAGGGSRRTGFQPLQANDAKHREPAKPDDALPVNIEPGSVLAAALLTGDLEFSALGTCTEVIGNRVIGFGHPFNGEGATAIPMGSGTVASIIPNLVNSFKVGAIDRILGAIDVDAAVGVGGELGAQAATFPITVNVDSPQGRQSFNFRSVRHPALTPVLLAASVQASIGSRNELPLEHTLDYDVTFKFTTADQREKFLHYQSVATTFDGPLLVRTLAMTAAGVQMSPFGKINVTSVSVDVLVDPQIRQIELQNVRADSSIYAPGDTAKLFVDYQPYRQQEQSMTIDLEIPADFPEGSYQVEVSDASTFMSAQAILTPYQFVATDVDSLFEALSIVGKMPQNAVYARLTGVTSGLSVGRQPMPRLPGSHQVILQGSGRSDVLPLGGSITRRVDVKQSVLGSVVVGIEVKKKTR